MPSAPREADSATACRAWRASTATAPAAAQEKYPERSVRVIIPFAAGSASDVVGRIVLDRMGDDLGQRFVIENQAGGENFDRMRTEAADHQVEKVGGKLRSMMPWISQK